MNKTISIPLSLAGVISLPFLSIISPAAANTDSVEEPLSLQRSLKDDVRFRWSLQAETQAAGTPNQAGVNFFIPLAVNDDSVLFIDTEFNANFADIDGSSIVNTDVAGTSLSTSTRLGYRWLNDDRSWMYGVNAGYDSRNLNTGEADKTTVTDKRDVTFQQVGLGLEAVSEDLNLNAYALLPTGDIEQVVNSYYSAGALYTYGIDIGFPVAKNCDAFVGYFYQKGDDITGSDGSSDKTRLAYSLNEEILIGSNFSYGEGFGPRLSADITYRFGGNGHSKSSNTKAWSKPLLAVTETVKNRDVRVHDKCSTTACRIKRCQARGEPFSSMDLKEMMASSCW